MAYDVPTERDKKAWAVAQIHELLKKGIEPESGERWTQTSLAKALGVTKGQIWHIVQTTPEAPRGPGEGTYAGLRRLLKIPDAAVFEKSIVTWRKSHPDTTPGEPTIDRDSRYPNRGRAAEFARASGISDEAIRAVMGVSLKSSADLNPIDWLEEMRAEDRRVRRGAVFQGSPLPRVEEETTRPGVHRIKAEHVKKK